MCSRPRFRSAWSLRRISWRQNWRRSKAGDAGDYTSHDLEDLLAVVDGREGLLEEVGADTEELRKYLADEIDALLNEPRFLDALPGHLLPDDASQARIPLLLGRLKGLS